MIERFNGTLPVVAAALAAGMALAAPASAQPKADSIWSGGPILTMNDKAMRAEAVAVADGKILAVGKRSRGHEDQGPDDPARWIWRAERLCPASSMPTATSSSAACRRFPPTCWPRPMAKSGTSRRLQQTLRDWIADERGRRRQGQAHRRLRLRQLPAGRTAPPDARRPRRGLEDIPDPPRPPVQPSWRLSTPPWLKIVGITRGTPDPAGGVIQRETGQPRAERRRWRKPRSSRRRR